MVTLKSQGLCQDMPPLHSDSLQKQHGSSHYYIKASFSYNSKRKDKNK